MTGSFHILLFEGTPHVDKEHDCDSKLQTLCILCTHSSLPADRFLTETGGSFAFTWYHCKISYRSEISPRYKNRGELTPGWLAPAWHFVVVSCKQIYSHERKPEWTHSRAKVAPVSCKHPLRTNYKPKLYPGCWRLFMQGFWFWVFSWRHLNLQLSKLLAACEKSPLVPRGT